MVEYFEFLDGGVSPYHVVEQSQEELKKLGFIPLNECEEWHLEPGKKYFVTRNQSGIIAFGVPEGTPRAYHMIASHSDSPTFRVKKQTAGVKGYTKAEVEGYGGMIYSSWLDRPLSMAGRVIVKKDNCITSRLVYADKDLCVIPNLAIHFNREINSGYKYNPQVDLQPLLGGKDGSLEQVIRDMSSCREGEEILDQDLFLTVRQKAVKLGNKGEFYMAPRIDDLGCVYTSLKSFLQAPVSGEFINVWCVFDNEEVGSGTRQGALSDFLPEVMSRIEDALLETKEKARSVRAASLLISADNAHAAHPNLGEKSDPQFPVYLNGGVVVKYNASQKYTTTAMTAAIFSELCKKAGVSVQPFANRADIPGGSTLGNLLSHKVSIPMVDVGLPQLSMHSALETAGCQDVTDMISVFTEFYKSSVIQEKEGTWFL